MKYLFCSFLLVQASFLVGCSSPTSVDGVVPATGVVTYQGQPVAGAAVTFAPDQSGRACSGMTDENGRFAMTTLQPGDGAMPGSYNVLISKSEVVGELSNEDAIEYLAKHNTEPPITVKELLPVKYKRADTSGLSAVVTEGGENDFIFDLTN